MEKELREAVTDLCHSDPEAAEIVLRFVQLINSDERNQSAASMTMHLGMAMSEAEDADVTGQMEDLPMPPPLVRATSSG